MIRVRVIVDESHCQCPRCAGLDESTVVVSVNCDARHYPMLGAVHAALNKTFGDARSELATHEARAEQLAALKASN